MRASEKDLPVEGVPKLLWSVTGKSVSEPLILKSVNPQYDKRLFIEFPENYKFRTYCIQILL